MSETEQEARLRLFLAEYEHVCKRYSLIIVGSKVWERYEEESGMDSMYDLIQELKEGGINA